MYVRLWLISHHFKHIIKAHTREDKEKALEEKKFNPNDTNTLYIRAHCKTNSNIQISNGGANWKTEKKWKKKGNHFVVYAVACVAIKWFEIGFLLAYKQDGC